MDIPEFDVRVLTYIAKNDVGYNEKALCAKFGQEAPLAVQHLQQQCLVYRNEYGLYTAMPDGMLEAKRWNVKQVLAKKERWKERIFGFICGVATTVISGIIIKFFG